MPDDIRQWLNMPDVGKDAWLVDKAEEPRKDDGKRVRHTVLVDHVPPESKFEGIDFELPVGKESWPRDEGKK